MTRHFTTKKLVAFSIFATLILFAFSGSHPTTGSGGYTGAPGDNVCTTCHTPGGVLDGNIAIGGLPGSVTPNTTYPLTITITNTAGSAVRAGFQMVSLKANLANGGTFSVPATESNAQVKTAGGKSYVGHQPAKNFSANEVIYNVEWTAPASATGDITVYAAAMIANGANGNSNDKFATTNMAVTLGGGGDPLMGTFSNIADASCSDSNDGSATINVTGGSGNYTYNWDNGEMNATAVMLSGGQHTVTVTDDSNNQIIEMVTIGSPSPIIPAIIFQNDAICNGEMSGSAELTANGGTPGFSYSWGNGIMGAIQNNLAANNYQVTITDLNNCTAVIGVTIGEPDPLEITIIGIDEPSCNGEADGMITVEATGGNGNFIYNWLDGIGVPNGGTLSLIPMGDYQLEVIDQQGCINQTSITLGEPEEVTSTVMGTDVLCFGDSDGTATAEGAGGSGSFTYEWSNGDIDATASGLSSGTYFVTVSDSNNCTSVNSYEVLEPATAVEAGISIITQPNCGNQDGELSAFALGGTAGYTYLWNNGTTNPILTNIGSGTYSITVTDLNNCTSESTIDLQDNDGVTLAANDVGNNSCFGGSEGSATISASGGSGIYTYTWSNGGMNQTETNLPAGNYTITVTDEGNCTGEITIEITEPDAFAGNETLTNISCNGAENGSIQLNATGGTGELSYAWNTGDTTDAIFDLIPGIFRVTITDGNDCMEEIEFVISEPDPILAGTVESNLPSCPGDMDGSINIDPAGGTGNLSILWSTGDTTITASNLSAGDYSVTITDENTCEVNFDFTLDDPTALAISSSVVTPTCNDSDNGSATLSLIGGSGNYTIEWSTGDSTLTVENLAGGLYTVTVTDENNCSNQEEIEIMAPPAIEPNISSTNETSNGANDGTATTDPQNGVAPYSFVWSTGDTTQSLQNLPPGMYAVTVSDANNCMVEASAIVNNGDCNITSTVEIQNVSCYGLMDGAISVDLTGAVDPISYLWSNEATSQSITGLDIGEYSVTISDANNCQLQIVDIEITEPEEIIASDPIITDASSPTSADGSIAIEFSGGTGELSIEYTDANGNPIGITNFDNLTPGAYGALVTDENGCMQFFGIFIVDFISAIEDVSPIVANVYPNPAQAFFILEAETQLISTPQVFSVTGQLIDLEVEKGAKQYRFNTQYLSNGVYYLKLASESDITLRKIIVTK